MTDTARITLRPLGEVVEAPRGADLQSVLFGRGVEFPCGGEGQCGRCRVRVVAGSLSGSGLGEAAGARDEEAGWRLACRSRVDGDVTLEVGQWEGPILSDDSAFAFSPCPGFGIAVDVGTTTLVAQLLNRETGQVLGVVSALNPQAHYGSDVVTRLGAALEETGAAGLRTVIRRAIGEMVRHLLASTRTDPGDLRRVVLVGNMAMHHLFCGLDVRPLALAPFDSPRSGVQVLAPRELEWGELEAAEVVFLPGLGGFVGSDVLAGILATRLHESTRLSVLLDLGTNGEIVLGNGGKVLCASTAAGPAFEGSRITMGMRAAAGAIARVRLHGRRLECTVLGGGPPGGICGSGLVDAVAAGLQVGAIRPDGRLADGGQAWPVCPPVSLTQKDIREVQLAKAAVAAGLRVLLRAWGASEREVEVVHLAGAFGNSIDARSARRIGLIGSSPGAVKAAGNTALLGAKLALFGGAPDGLGFEDLRRRVRHLPLASDPAFAHEFVEALQFPRCSDL